MVGDGSGKAVGSSEGELTLESGEGGTGLRLREEGTFIAGVCVLAMGG